MLAFVEAAYYGDIGFTVQEYYTARQEGSQVIKRVRIHENKKISNNHVIKLDGVQYAVGRTYTAMVKGVSTTDITLEILNNEYGFVGGDA